MQIRVNRVRDLDLQTFEENSLQATEQHTHTVTRNESQCHFCLSKNIIMAQLAKLKQLLIAKNQRIRQLQQFIDKLSKMAFVDSAQSQDNRYPRMSSNYSESQSRSSRCEQLTFQMDVHVTSPSFNHHKNDSNHYPQLENDELVQISNFVDKKRVQQDKGLVEQVKNTGTNKNIGLRNRFMEIMQPQQRSLAAESVPHSEGTVGDIHQCILEPQTVQSQSTSKPFSKNDWSKVSSKQLTQVNNDL